MRSLDLSLSWQNVTTRHYVKGGLSSGLPHGNRKPCKEATDGLEIGSSCDLILVYRDRKGCGWQMFLANRIKASSGLEVRDGGDDSQRPWPSKVHLLSGESEMLGSWKSKYSTLFTFVTKELLWGS